MAPQLQRKKRRVARTTVCLDHCGSRRQVLWGEDLEGKNAEEFTKRRVGEDACGPSTLACPLRSAYCDEAKKRISKHVAEWAGSRALTQPAGQI